MAPTAASRPGGKFASAASRPGGKFATLGNNPPRGKFAPDPTDPSTSTVPATTADGDGTTDDDRLRYFRRHRPASATNRPPPPPPPHPVFDDLDRAERLVLDLLSLSSSSADALSRLSCPTTGVVQGGGKGGLEGKEELEEQIRKNGREYVEKLGNIYSLLEPRAHLVVSYGNLTSSTAAAAEGGEDGRAGGGTKSTPLLLDDDTVKKKGTKDGRNNMYASRLEMRLAIERRDLMKELVRLEKQEVEREHAANIDTDTNVNENIGDSDALLTATAATTTVSNTDPMQIDDTAAMLNSKRKRESDDET